jgi:hypothetical protein
METWTPAGAVFPAARLPPERDPISVFLEQAGSVDPYLVLSFFRFS